MMTKEQAEKYTILIADDSATMRMMVSEILEYAGYKVLIAEDGIGAAAMAFKHFPHLIISDIEMPNMNGYQVCRLLKNDPAVNFIPIIILTSKAGSGSVFWGYQTGADFYLLKDFQPAELLDAIERLLKKYDGVAPDPLPLPEVVDSQRIMEKLNLYMDARLFEMTLINEINQVTVTLTSISETLSSLLDILDNAVDNLMIGFVVFSGEKEILIDIKIKQPVSQRMLEIFQYQSLEDLALTTNSDLTEFEIEVEIQDERFISEENDGNDGNMEMENNLLFSIPLRTRDTTLGTLNVYHPHMQTVPLQEKQLLEKLAPYITTAIDTIAMHNKIKSLSVIDGLTQLYNRRYVIELFKNEFIKTTRYHQDLSLMMIDIDDFKKINDTYGHLSGDVVLKSMSAIIKRCLRNVDLPGRYGGEEFILVLPETGREQAVIVAERIRKQVEEHRFKSINNEILQVTVSIGLADVSDLENKSNELELIKVADSRLYKAKRTGKNKVVSQ